MCFKSTQQNFNDKNNELIWKYFLNLKQFHKHTSCLITFLYPLDASVLQLKKNLATVFKKITNSEIGIHPIFLWKLQPQNHQVNKMCGRA